MKIRYTDEAHNKKRIRSKSYADYRAGRIEKQPCAICGDPNSQIHHIDYSTPQAIEWLCRKHHWKLHYPVAQNKKLTRCSVCNKPIENLPCSNCKKLTEVKTKSRVCLLAASVVRGEITKEEAVNLLEVQS
jgi:hypothetical protein